MRLVLTIGVFLTIPLIAQTATIKIPTDYTTIQTGINYAKDGDVLVVAPGTYVENISYHGKKVTVRSSSGPGVTVIDGSQTFSCVTFNKNEDLNSILDGFTVTNGGGNSGITGGKKGGGVYCENSSPTIINCRIIFNCHKAFSGGGMYNLESSPSITNCHFSGNGRPAFGGGMYNDLSSPIITNCVFSGNSVLSSGGGMYNDTSSPILTNCVFAGNWADDMGGGMYSTTVYSAPGGSKPILNNCFFLGNGVYIKGGGMYCFTQIAKTAPILTNCAFIGNTSAAGNGGGLFSFKSPVELYNCTFSGNAAINGGGISNDFSPLLKITNCILWGDTPNEIHNYTSPFTVTYSCIQGGFPGTGNIQSDPLFTKGRDGFSYLSQIAAGQSADSPCLNAGSDLAANLGLDTYWTRTDQVTDSGIVDMGYHFGPFLFPSLQADTGCISKNSGGSINFLLLGDLTNANKNYMIFGGISGISPGIPLPGSILALPINSDFLTKFIIYTVNRPMFLNFMGNLNATGNGEAKMTLPPFPSYYGVRMHLAYALMNSSGSWDFVSNPFTIRFNP